MNIYIFIAGILCFLLGIVHSILGEFLIFKSKRNKGSLVPSQKSPDLKERHLRIIWATWHLASFFGLSLGIILIKIAYNLEGVRMDSFDFILQTIMYTMFLSSILVFIGTKAKHPGWVVLLIIGLLLFLGN